MIEVLRGEAMEIVCYCSNVTKEQILEAIAEGATTLQDIKRMTGACTLCRCEELHPDKRCCGRDILKILKEHKK